MAKFNSDVVFLDGSGQVRVINGDLTLRANPNGDGHIIIGNSVSLRPENNCDASDAIDLGQEDLRWKTLYSCSGNFLDRPTVNGSGVLLQGEAAEGGGVTTIEELAGVVDLDSPDESINITVNGQAIELTTPSGYAPSGASFILADYNDNDHLTDARKLSATSGMTLDDQGARSGSGIVVKLDFDTTPTSGQVLSWNNNHKLEWITGPTQYLDYENLLFTVPSAGVDVFVAHLSATTPVLVPGRYRIAWHTVWNYDSTQRDARIEINRNGNLVTEEIRMESSDGGTDQRQHTSGFVYENFFSSSTHLLTIEYARTNTGDRLEIYESHIEIWRVGETSV